jgi:hypothetical protein
MAKAKLTPGGFKEIADSLQKRLTAELLKEIEDCALPELSNDSATDLWSPPKVDSKTVVKLSPTVKEVTGWRLDPTWIRKGGYLTVPDAVTHVMAQIKTHCVAETASVKAEAAAAAA